MTLVQNKTIRLVSKNDFAEEHFDTTVEMIKEAVKNNGLVSLEITVLIQEGDKTHKIEHKTIKGKEAV